jgi:hypothetical protein
MGVDSTAVLIGCGRSPDGIHLLRYALGLLFPLVRAVMSLLRRFRCHLGAVTRVQGGSLAARFPVLLHPGPVVLDEASWPAIQVATVGTAALGALVAVCAHAVQLAVHLWRAIEL